MKKYKKQNKQNNTKNVLIKLMIINNAPFRDTHIYGRTELCSLNSEASIR